MSTVNEFTGEEALDDQEKEDLLTRIRKRYQDGEGADYENRRLHTEDLAFIYDAESGAQWDPMVLGLRKGRPSYTFNRVLAPVNLLLGDQLQSAPAIKVRPLTNGTQAVADVLGGLWRSIEQDSRAETIYGLAYKHAVGGGFGEMRLVPEYQDDNSMDQVLRLRGIPNPLTVIRDPESTDPWGADAMWCMVGDRISKDKYEAEYPDELALSFQMSRDGMGWRTDDMIRVVEYFEKIPYDKEIALLSDGRVIPYDDEAKQTDAHFEAQGLDKSKAARIVRTRKVQGWKIRWLKCDGSRILEGPIVYNWTRIPVVRMPGRYINIEGRQKYQSLVRHSKDSQRALNFQGSDAIERSALVPKARYFVTPKMLLGFEDVWNNSNTTPRIYMPYNVDPAAPNNGMPFREQPIDVPQGALALAQAAAQNIQATMGIFDPALGNAEDMNRVSGKALVTHTRRSDLGSHEFINNYGKAIELLARCALDMIPTIYDAARIVRIIGQDGIEKLVGVNQPQGNSGDILHDLKAGSYDCEVTLGPSYQTARQETLATLIDAAQTMPVFAQVIPDLIARAIDSPDSDVMADRLRGALIKQGIIQPTPDDLKKMGGQQPQQPSPMQQAELTRAQALAARDLANAHIAAGKAQAGSLELHKVITETAGRHLANLLLAQKLGEPNAAQQAESAAAATVPQQAPPQQMQ